VNALMNRRIFGGSLLAGTGALAVRRLCSTGCLRDRRKSRSRVAILHADSYGGPLDRTLIEGLRLFDLSLRGKTVLLKPNLVEYIPGTEVNTDPRLVGAAANASSPLERNRFWLVKAQDTSGTPFWFSPRVDWKRNSSRGESGS
jgi:hypothetical protein